MRARILVLVLALATPVLAQDGGLLERVKKESAIERRMALAEIRGSLGLYKKPEPADWSPREHGKGRLEVKDGVPVLHLEGTPEEMGEQHGKLLGREARALAHSYLRAFLGREIDGARVRARELFWKHLSADERTEIEAFASASGISLEDTLLAQCFPDLYRAWACSTIAAVATAAETEPLLARNLDFVGMGFIHDYSCVVVARPKGKTPYVSVGWPGLVGVLSGQNASGVALAVMVVHNEKGCASGVPFQLAFRRALETAKTADDVKTLLDATPLTVTNNLMVVDKDDRARVLELDPEGIHARYPDRKGRLFATNHFVSREKRESRASLTFLSSMIRLGAVDRTCRSRDRIGVPLAIDGLRSAAPARMNVQAMVFTPRSGDVWVALGKPPAADREFVRLGGDWLLPR